MPWLTRHRSWRRGARAAVSESFQAPLPPVDWRQMSESTGNAETTASDRLESLGRQAYRVLRAAIRSGAIQPHRRYSEAELAEVLGVSRTPVREALKALEREGVLRTASRRGYELRTYTDEEIEELLELRKLLERLTVSRLAAKATADDIAQLHAALDRQAEHSSEGNYMVSLDEDFHLLIANLARLRRTHDILASLRSAMAVVYGGTPPAANLNEEIIGEHRAIVDAIAAHEPGRAAKLIEHHIDHATKPLLEAARERREQRTITPLTAR